MSDQRLEVMIASAQQSDEQRWEQQLAMIRRSGATYDPGSRNWRLELDLTDGQRVAVAMMALCSVARTYGTTVLVVDPTTGMPALIVDEAPTEIQT